MPSAGIRKKLSPLALTGFFGLIRNKKVVNYTILSQNREMKNMHPLKPTLVAFLEVYTDVSNFNYSRHIISTQ